jgi:hyperosmotically inducible protein
VGGPERTEVVRLALRHIAASIDEASRAEDLTDHFHKDTLAVVVASSLAGHSIRALISHLRQQSEKEDLAIFALVDDETKDAETRRLYGEGATAVFEWPREKPFFSRLVVELLAVELAQGSVGAPDTALARAVRAHLKLVRGHSPRLRVRVDAGFAFLSGSVTHLWQKDLVERLVSDIPGVRTVVVRGLLVEPSARTDVQIKRSIRMLLRDASDIDETTLAVNVERGYVTLAGSVTDRRELNRVRRLLASVKGVRDIDRLVVLSTSQKQRDHVTAQRLGVMLHGLFPDQQVSVAVFAGVAVLSGTVGRLGKSLDIQSIIEGDDAVQRVVNKIAVQDTSPLEGS